MSKKEELKEYKPEYLVTPAKITKEELKIQLVKERERDDEIIPGTFKNLEVKGAALEFGYKKYPDQEFMMYRLEDGQEYSIPYGVIKHINNNCYIKEYQEAKDEFGKPLQGVQQAAPDGRYKNVPMQAAKKNPRFLFIAPGAPKDIYPSNIIEVTASY